MSVRANFAPVLWKYKYRVIFVLVWALSVLYEVQLVNKYKYQTEVKQSILARRRLTGHFRVAFGLCFKMSPRATVLMKMSAFT